MLRAHGHLIGPCGCHRWSKGNHQISICIRIPLMQLAMLLIDAQSVCTVAVSHSYLVKNSVVLAFCQSELCKAPVQGLPQTEKQQCQGIQRWLPCLRLFCQQFRCKLARYRWDQTPWLEGRPRRPHDPCWQPNEGQSDPMSPARMKSTYNQKPQECEGQTRAIKPMASCTNETQE